MSGLILIGFAAAAAGLPIEPKEMVVGADCAVGFDGPASALSAVAGPLPDAEREIGGTGARLSVIFSPSAFCSPVAGASFSASA